MVTPGTVSVLFIHVSSGYENKPKDTKNLRINSSCE